MVTVVDALVQQHGLVERVGPWAVQGGVEKVALEVPESLQQVVEQQLRQLSAEDLGMLESGSVTGMQFSAATVAAGLEERVDTVEERCSSLVRRGQFLQSSGIEEWPDGTVVGRYRFRHTLYRQAVYDRRRWGSVSSFIPALGHVSRPGMGGRLKRDCRCLLRRERWHKGGSYAFGNLS